MRDLAVRWARDERGATAIEYGLIIALVFLALVTAAGTFGDSLKAMFDSLSAIVTAALS